jgi:alpha-ketoglutarate-dependent taurine dioxygenase
MRPSFLNEKKLPVLLEPDAGHAKISEQLLAANRDRLNNLLLSHGALLFRGFSIEGITEFADFARRFAGRDLLDYAGGASPRIILADGVYTSTEYPSDLALPLHNELSYTFRWPEYLFFYCVTPPESGGETPLGDSRNILKLLDQQVVRRFKERNIRYERNLTNDPDSEYSWQAAFETEDRAAVEDYCASGEIAYKWNDDGSLRLTEVRPATAVHPKTHDEVWFNQADGFHPSTMGAEALEALMRNGGEDKLRLNAFFGDGGRIDISDLEQIRHTINREIALFPWQAGDVLVVDNMLACHGRMPFSGPRKIAVAMA